MAQLTTRELIEIKRKEIAELESKLIAEIKLGTIACVTGESVHGDIEIGTLVKITELNYSEIGSFRADLLDGSDWDVFTIAQIDVLSREEARERLVADIDRTLDEAYGVKAEVTKP